GYKTDGTPKYRTVINKFAILDVFIFTDRNVRTKVSQIILGPVDSVTLHPIINELASLASSLPSATFTSNIADIQSVQTSQPITVAPPPAPVVVVAPTATAPVAPKVNITPRDYFVRESGIIDQIYYVSGNSIVYSPLIYDILSQEEKQRLANSNEQLAVATARLIAQGYPINTIRGKQFFNELNGRPAPIIMTNSFAEFFGATPATPQAPAPVQTAPSVCGAGNLSEFFAAKGEKLPSITERGEMYRTLGLGFVEYYVGTAEQNTRLLKALQKGAGCSI
ncbi:MAG: hypothetical protein Q7T18_06445, partial [Sedimentisphaerales bacterium]|nr:hypothetical protein [Sedimentisphaerales bacterium]